MIINYEDKYFNDIRNITYNYWSKEVEMSDNLKEFIYTFLVKYYLSNYKYSFIYKEEFVDAFLLSSLKKDINDSLNYFNKCVSKFNSIDKENAKRYLDYLNYNHNKVLKHMGDKSIYLALIASIKPHKGLDLIRKLIEVGKVNNNDYIYLWTDETCNYKYYEKHQFELVETYNVVLYNVILKTFIYRYKI